MAENSCTECSASPEKKTEYLDKSTDYFTVAVERCPLCSESNRPFYCKTCVDDGQFIHSNATFPDSYEALHRKWDFTKKDREHILERFKSSIESTQRQDVKKTEIDQCRRNIELLKLSLAATKQLINQEKIQHERTRRDNLMRFKKGKKHKEKKKMIVDYIEKVTETIAKKKEKLAEKHTELMHLRQKHIGDLTTYIFEVSEVRVKGDSMGGSDHVREELHEASQTAYVRGRWISSSQYKIVEPTLPSHGEYTQYNIMVSKTREDGNTEVASPGNPSNSICAGLCYTAQLVSVLAHILKVCLPKRQCYSDFCVSDLSEKQFNTAVSRLNKNVLYLCFSQGVDTEEIEPKHTLHNILLLLGSQHLGRSGPFDVIQDMIDSVEDSNGQSEESDDEVNPSCDEPDVGEWERVPDNIPVPTMAQGVSSVQTMGYMSQNMSDSSLSASGVLSTITSFFRR